MDGPFFIAPEGRGLLTVEGDDRRAFLQGLISNDIERVDATGAIYAGFLTAQGRFLHDFFVVELEGRFFLDAEAPRLDDLKRRLSLYRLRSKVTLGVANQSHAVAVLYGAGALDTLRLPEEAGRVVPFAGGVAYSDPRFAALGARAVVPRDRLGAFAQAGFKPGTLADYDQLRIALGVPDGSRDLTVEKALLLENGFEELNGVDWKKGCYVGQELTARMKYRLLVRKRLMPVRIDGPPPPPGTPIMLGDQEAGEMRSASGSLGLALLRLEAVEQADREGRPLQAGDTALTPIRPARGAP